MRSAAAPLGTRSAPPGSAATQRAPYCSPQTHTPRPAARHNTQLVMVIILNINFRANCAFSKGHDHCDPSLVLHIARYRLCQVLLKCTACHIIYRSVPSRQSTNLNDMPHDPFVERRMALIVLSMVLRAPSLLSFWVDGHGRRLFPQQNSNSDIIYTGSCRLMTV